MTVLDFVLNGEGGWGGGTGVGGTDIVSAEKHKIDIAACQTTNTFCHEIFPA